MVAELLASLRGAMGGAGNYFANPWVLYGILLATYLIYRKTS
jgi:hypothetical protein